MSPPVVAEHFVGLLINIESIDGGGKTTQAPLVKKLLEDAGLSVALFSFPDTPSRCHDAGHESHFSTGVLIDGFLATNPEERINLIDLNDSFFRRNWTWDEDGQENTFSLVNLPTNVRDQMAAVVQEKLVQMLFSINRRERASALRAAVAENDVVIVGRYLSAWTYGIDGGASRMLVSHLEEDLPLPDLSFLLDIDPAVARARRTDEQRDRYEVDFDKQARIRGLYNQMVRDDAEAAEDEGRPTRFVRLDATLPAGDISAQISAMVIERAATAAAQQG